jgi:intracellular sulfur oxidation DsrE/DsrF family protein
LKKHCYDYKESCTLPVCRYWAHPEEKSSSSFFNNLFINLGVTMKSNKQRFLKALVLASAFLGSASVYAADQGNDILAQCQYLPLATNLAMPKKFGTKNTSVCVDIPVTLNKVKVIFNMDTMAVDGKGNANGLKHMFMMGSVMKEEIKKGLIKPEDVSIIGIMHGAALKWATKSAPEQQKKWIEQIFKLKKEGVNIQLEACAAAMNGAGLTKKNLYTYDAEGNPDPAAHGRIYVNQGAFGREVYLQQQGYAYAQEGNQPRLKKSK